MPLIDEALSVGLTALADVMARAMTFRGSPVTVDSVEWNPRDVVTADGELAFEGRDTSSVLVSKSAVTTKPEKNESFKDADGKYHKVETVYDLKNKWRCICLVSE